MKHAAAALALTAWAGCAPAQDAAERVPMDDWTGRYQATFEGYPRWSPDGSEIVFSSDAAGDMGLFIADVATGAVARVPTGDGGAGHPNWAGPDALVFDSNRDGDRDIFRVDLLTGDVTQLVDHDGADGAPAASADGRRVMYYSERAGNADLRVVDLDTGEDVPLIETEADEHLGSWSPDGALIALQTGIHGSRDPAVFDPATGDLRVLDDDPARDHFVAWAGGEAVIFSSDRSGAPRLYRARLDGVVERVDVGVEADELVMPSVSPDGTMIAFIAKQGRPETVYVFDTRTGEARPLVAR